ncbi:phasin family protein [Alteriqipengyuania sp. 357]
MADQNTDTADAAAQKANESASAAKSERAQAEARAKPAADAVAAPAAKTEEAPAKAEPEAKKPATGKSPVSKAPVSKDRTSKKVAAPKKAVAKKAPAKRKTTKTSPAKTGPAKAAPVTGANSATKTETKDTIMATKTQTKTANAASDMANEMQTRLAGMYEKGTEMTGEMVTFQRANAEAMAEASKILFTGMQDMTRTAVEEGRRAADQMSEDARLMAAAKSPTELVKLQGDILRRSFDSVVATSSKNTEAWIKLTNDAFAPLTSRMSEAVDKMNKIAA